MWNGAILNLHKHMIESIAIKTPPLLPINDFYINFTFVYETVWVVAAAVVSQSYVALHWRALVIGCEKNQL